MGKLTAKTTEKLVKAGVAGLTNDGDGLYLKVADSGTGASWVFRYKIDGKSRKIGLGKYPGTSLSEARDKAADARKLLKSGMDPLATRDKEREEKRLESQAALAKSTPFKTHAAHYIAAHRSGWKNAKHAQQWENTLATYAEPIIGNLPASEITTAHILEILQPLWIEKTETANRLRNRIELVLDAAKARGMRDGENPARWRGHLDKLLPKRSKVRAIEHHPALPWPELPSFMSELANHDELTYKAMRLTILTACRTSEVLGATWEEIALDTRVWTIPAARMKARKEHRVPLSDAAIEVLDSLPRITGSPYLFPSTRQGKHLSNMSMLMGLRRMGREDLTMHGFRSTFRDWAAEQTNHPREVCEMALAHKIAEGAEAAYWRGDIFEKRRALMADWAAFATAAPSTNLIQGDFNRA